MASIHLLLISGSTRAASTNTALLRTAQAVLPAGMTATLYPWMGAIVPGYIHVEVVEAACARVPVGRGQVGADGLIADPAIRQQVAEVLSTIASALANRKRGRSAQA